SMVGRTLSVVTLQQAGIALSDNYLKVELAAACAPNRIIEVEVDGVGESGVREKSALSTGKPREIEPGGRLCRELSSH
ncbi:MAG: hypothetical protein ABSD56_08560, partial [Bryobacteraceae bacterium]